MFEGTALEDKMSGKFKFQNGMCGGNWEGVKGESSITPKEILNVDQSLQNLSWGVSLPNLDMTSGEESLQRYPEPVILVCTKQGIFSIDYEITWDTNDAYMIRSLPARAEAQMQVSWFSRRVMMKQLYRLGHIVKVQHIWR